MTIADQMHDTAITLEESLEHYDVRERDPLGHKAVILLAEDLKLLMRYFDSSTDPDIQAGARYELLASHIKKRFGIDYDKTN